MVFLIYKGIVTEDSEGLGPGLTNFNEIIFLGMIPQTQYCYVITLNQINKKIIIMYIFTNKVCDKKKSF